MKPTQYNTKQFKANALVVDDNPTNLIVAEVLLKSLGLSTVSVANGQQAIQALKKNDFDVIFMDCHMPVFDGYDTTRNIRSPNLEIKNSDIIIIAMTASTMPDDKEKRISSGINDYIAKPIKIMALQKKLEQWLSIDKHVINKEHMLQKANSPSSIANSESKEELFDYEALFNRLSGNQELIKSISLKFISSIESHIQNINTEIANQDLSKIVSLAHKLKGSSVNLGCMQLTELSSTIEIAGKESNMEVILEAAEKLHPCYLKSVEAIHKKIL